MRRLFINNFPITFIRSYFPALLPIGLASLTLVLQPHAMAQTTPPVKTVAMQTEQKALPDQFLSQTGAAKLDVTLGKSTLLKLPNAIKRISVGSPSVADVMMINPQEVYVLGKIVGMTNITLWTKDGKSTVIDVNVLMDVTALRQQVQAIMPDEKDIQITAAGDSLIVSGMVSNTLKADRVVALAEAFLRTSILNMMLNLQGGGQGDQPSAGAQAGGGGMGGMGGMQAMQTLRQGSQHNENSQGAGAGLGNFKVINLMGVRDNQQVMLEVKVAEVNRTEAEKLGFDFQGALRKSGSAWTQIVGGLIGGSPAGLLLGKNPVATGLPFASSEGGSFLIDAEKKDNVIKILAEPNIVAISGQEASFLVGGEIMIPVSSGVGSTVRLQSKQFGVGLIFLPTVLEEGRINLRVNPEVSELVSFQQVASTGLGAIVAVPTFKTRRISTTVQLRDGQSLAIGGLLQDNFKEQIKRFPMLGEVPVLGSLFSSSDFLMDKTELMIIVTPRLVQPMQPDHSVPTDAFIRPGRGEFLLQGRLERRDDPSDNQDAPQQMIEKSGNPASSAEPSGFQMK
ncbi:type II and III secretion system protein family protein [Nitrosomonas sp. Is35]|uniref:type II and III secretion system protein family protein n=1 Tax=Nitrosomonas sp. Is35 TaxID=3080534 RepID=UPI00294B2ADA|nr:type II and III secretion system protein family protein [Nitrosomonas sp. Is35]MDV6348224.1 type II and III secretion system protein family protein [Nitrosomonas sp. Is35]